MLTVGGIARLVRDLTPEQRARVVHVEHQPFDVYVGRKPKWGNPRWGNPEELKKHGYDRQKCLRAYAEWLCASERGALIQAYAHRLKSKALGCHCRRPGHDVLCHGLVLVALAESDTL